MIKNFWGRDNTADELPDRNSRCGASPSSTSSAPRIGNSVSNVARLAPELTVVVPTFNKSGNIAILVERLREVLSELEWEAIFVDDNSPDGTGAEVRRIGEADRRIRCIRRIGRRGLAGACIEGVLPQVKQPTLR